MASRANGVFRKTRPITSSIIFGGWPAAGITVGVAISRAMPQNLYAARRQCNVYRQCPDDTASRFLSIFVKAGASLLRLRIAGFEQGEFHPRQFLFQLGNNRRRFCKAFSFADLFECAGRIHRLLRANLPGGGA